MGSEKLLQVKVHGCRGWQPLNRVGNVVAVGSSTDDTSAILWETKCSLEGQQEAWRQGGSEEVLRHWNSGDQLLDLCH